MVKTTTPGNDPEFSISANYRRYTLMILVLGYTSSHVDRNIVGILMQPIKMELGLSDTQLGFLSGFAFALFYATLGIPIALWADRGNRRNIIAYAITIWSGMTAVCGLAGNFAQLALARVGVGIGEAGSSPPSHAIIADLYKPDERSSAMAVYSLGAYFGVMIGFLVGAYVSVHWGWRSAFFVVGLPGLLISALVRFTLPEPPRGFAEGLQAKPAPALKLPDVWSNIGAGFRHLWYDLPSRHTVIGVTLVAFVGYGRIIWGPAFFERSFDMSRLQIGQYLAAVVGIVGGLGAMCGGMLADRLGTRDIRWRSWIVGIAKLLAAPLLVVFYLADKQTALLIYIPITLLNAFYLGPSFAVIQSRAPLEIRSLAAAIMFFIINIIGLGLGPQLIGILSDALRPEYGQDSLRYALLCTSFVGLWAALHYFIAGRHMRSGNNPAI
jgi:MFS family permease